MVITKKMKQKVKTTEKYISASKSGKLANLGSKKKADELISLAHGFRVMPVTVWLTDEHITPAKKTREQRHKPSRRYERLSPGEL